MSKEYDLYLREHRDNVKKGFEWIKKNLPDLLPNQVSPLEIDCQICLSHDASKDLPDEYNAYDRYFYGGNKSYEVVQDFRLAWLMHIHRNPHHWQHWVLINDDPNEGMIALDMSYKYILEMICDWWAFSWKKGDLTEIFKWYNQHKTYMILSDNTRKNVEMILDKIADKLGESED